MTIFRQLFLHAKSKAILPEHFSYAFADHLQSRLVNEHVAWRENPTSGPPPPPSVIFFSPPPTYTFGRRQKELNRTDKLYDELRAPLYVPNPSGAGGQPMFFVPQVYQADRGGLTTYHGPGQLVIWPVINMHSPLHAHFTVSEYACLLQKTTVAALARRYGIDGITTENPGVWVRSPNGTGQERKIAAMGVHIRRRVTGLGVSINYSVPTEGPAHTNPWGRISPCGFSDKGVTSVCAELGTPTGDGAGPGDLDQELEAMAETWQDEFLKRLKMHEEPEIVKGFDGVQTPQDWKDVTSSYLWGNMIVKACPKN